MAILKFSDNCNSYLERLKKALSAENWKDYCITSQELKDALSAMGAERLSQWASNLEMASKKDSDLSLVLCREETAPFCAAILKLQEKLLKTSLFGI
jgi:HPt (histidine-containing phosphotransfer) domain-containing protein